MKVLTPKASIIVNYKCFGLVALPYIYETKFETLVKNLFSQFLDKTERIKVMNEIVVVGVGWMDKNLL